MYASCGLHTIPTLQAPYLADRVGALQATAGQEAGRRRWLGRNRFLVKVTENPPSGPMRQPHMASWSAVRGYGRRRI